MPGAIDARKVSRSIDAPLGRIMPDLTSGYSLLSKIVGGLSAKPSLIGKVRFARDSETIVQVRTRDRTPDHCNLAYSALACCRIGVSGSASFQSVRKSWYALRAAAALP